MFSLDDHHETDSEDDVQKEDIPIKKKKSPGKAPKAPRARKDPYPKKKTKSPFENPDPNGDDPDYYRVVENDYVIEETTEPLIPDGDHISEDLRKYYNPFVLILDGSPGLGKTETGRWIVVQKALAEEVDYIIVITGSKKYNSDWQDIVPKEYIFSDWSDVPTGAKGKQDEKTGQFTPHENMGSFIMHELQDPKRNPERRHLLVVFDDPVGKIPWKEPSFQSIISIHRHLCTSFICMTQWLNALPTIIKDAAPYVAMFTQSTARGNQIAFEYFGNKFLDEKNFKHELKKASYVEDPTDHNNRGWCMFRIGRTGDWFSTRVQKLDLEGQEKPLLKY